VTYSWFAGNRGTATVVGLVLILTFVVGAGASWIPLVAVFISAFFLCAAISICNPRFMVHLLIVVAFLAKPAFLPETVKVGPVGLYVYEVLLILTIIWIVLDGSSRLSGVSPAILLRKTGTPALLLGVFLLSTALAGAQGYLRGVFLPILATDMRGIADMAAGFCIALYLYFQENPKQYLRTFLWVVIASCAIIILAAATGIELQGRSEVAELYRVGGGVLSGGTGAVRYLTPATLPALLVLCGCIAWLIQGRRLSNTARVALMSAVIVCFLSYSRYQIIALAVSVTFSLIVVLVRRNFSALPNFALKAALVCGAVAFLIVPVISNFPAYRVVQENVDAYSTRVLSGLNPYTRANDSSTQDRVEENSLMLQAIESAPLFGNGFGYAYKPASGPASQFAANGGQYYGHNYYLWITMKAGLLGGLSFIGLIGVGIVRALKRSVYSIDSVVVGGCLSGIAATMVIAPLVNGYPSGLLFGSVLALSVIGVKMINNVGANYETKPESRSPELRDSTDEDRTLRMQR